MTPTTVEPEIVAAAANAGYWAELAGGGKVTAEVFDRHIAALEDELEEGRTVELNAIFMDRTPVRSAVRLLPHRAQEAHIRRADRRRGRLRRHP